jgi:hypothetical protein
VSLFNGKLDAMDLMAIEHFEKQERQKKLDYIVRAINESDDSTFDITPLCNNLGIRLTSDEFNWILEQVNDD